MVELLPRSATGQKITTYLNVITGPARDGEADGPRELHVIVLDNGRSRQLGDPHFEPILSCIRCGACLNVCPVYRQIGGHAYGSVYPGPIGAVLTPLLEPESPRATELADASSLCGACTETCPVKIPLHDMLVIQRQRNVAARRGTWLERAGFRLSASILRSPRLYSWAGRIARFVVSDSIRPRGWRERVLRPIAGWTEHRDLPAAPKRSFREQWDESEREGRAR
jgi:L-lactate dehydrogenase complex protein LldF